MNKNYTDLNFLLDRSGSMEGLKEDVIGGVNRFIKDQKAVPGECKLTLVQFDISPYRLVTKLDNLIAAGLIGISSSAAYPGNAVFVRQELEEIVNADGYQIIYNALDIKEAQPITSNIYKPRGATAYLDALAKLIEDTGKRLSALPDSERPEKVVVGVYTDGLENSSVKYRHKKAEIASMIKHQEEVYKWQFTFLGANFDAVAEGMSLGISQGATLTYAATTDGVNQGFAAMSNNITRYRVGDATNLTYTVEEREAAI